jgi:hypothetical protein
MLKGRDEEAVCALFVRPDAHRTARALKISGSIQRYLLEVCVFVQEAIDDIFIFFPLDGTGGVNEAATAMHHPGGV